MHLRPSSIATGLPLRPLALLLPALALAQVTPDPGQSPADPAPTGRSAGPDRDQPGIHLPDDERVWDAESPGGMSDQLQLDCNRDQPGKRPVPANTTHLRWTTVGIFGAPTSEDQLIGVVIPAGGSIPVSRPWYFGPCNQCNGSQPGRSP
jgi:hypothetical protein